MKLKGKVKVQKVNTPSGITADDKRVAKLVQDSIQYKDGQYEKGVSWKRDPEGLPDNYDMAVKRMMNAERQLTLDDKVSNDYNQIMEGYTNKSHINILEKDPENESKKWYLPQLAVIKSDKEATKTRIIFDVSTAQDGTSLNDIIHQGPKLQRDLVNVLLRF